jgi:hypothetical protein
VGHQLTDLWNMLGTFRGPLRIQKDSGINISDPATYRKFYSLLNSASVHDQMTFLLALNKQQQYPQTSQSQIPPSDNEIVRSLDQLWNWSPKPRLLDPINQKLTFIVNISNQLLVELAKADIRRTWVAVLYPPNWKYDNGEKASDYIYDDYYGDHYKIQSIKRPQIRIRSNVQAEVAKAVMNTRDRNFQVLVLATVIYLYKQHNEQHMARLISDMITRDPTLKRFFTNPINYLKDQYDNDSMVIKVVRDYFKEIGGVPPSEKQQMDLVTADGMKIEQLYKQGIYPSDDVKHQALASSEGRAINIMIKYDDSSPELEELAVRLQEFHRSHM